jgi:hypothetical protein
MLQDLNWEAVDAVARRQLRLYSELSDEMQLDARNRRAALRLNQKQWADWAEFLGDGPLPAAPPLPEMLRRVGRATHRLVLRAEQQPRA